MADFNRAQVILSRLAAAPQQDFVVRNQVLEMALRKYLGVEFGKGFDGSGGNANDHEGTASLAANLLWYTICHFRPFAHTLLGRRQVIRHSSVHCRKSTVEFPVSISPPQMDFFQSRLSFHSRQRKASAGVKYRISLIARAAFNSFLIEFLVDSLYAGSQELVKHVRYKAKVAGLDLSDDQLKMSCRAAAYVLLTGASDEGSVPSLWFEAGLSSSVLNGILSNLYLK